MVLDLRVTFAAAVLAAVATLHLATAPAAAHSVATGGAAPKLMWNDSYAVVSTTFTPKGDVLVVAYAANAVTQGTAGLDPATGRQLWNLPNMMIDGVNTRFAPNSDPPLVMATCAAIGNSNVSLVAVTRQAATVLWSREVPLAPWVPPAGTLPCTGSQDARAGGLRATPMPMSARQQRAQHVRLLRALKSRGLAAAAAALTPAPTSSGHAAAAGGGAPDLAPAGGQPVGGPSWTADGSLYGLMANSGFYALTTATGETAFSHPLPGGTVGLGVGSNPQYLVNGAYLVAETGSIVAIEASSGQLRPWRVYSSPDGWTQTDRGNIVLQHWEAPGNVAGVDTLTGNITWEFRPEYANCSVPIVRASPTGSKVVALVASTSWAQVTRIVVLDANTGHFVWDSTSAAPGAASMAFNPAASMLAVVRYLNPTTGGGALDMYCVDGSSSDVCGGAPVGKHLWRQPVPCAPVCLTKENFYGEFCYTTQFTAGGARLQLEYQQYLPGPEYSLDELYGFDAATGDQQFLLNTTHGGCEPGSPHQTPTEPTFIPMAQTFGPPLQPRQQSYFLSLFQLPPAAVIAPRVH